MSYMVPLGIVVGGAKPFEWNEVHRKAFEHLTNLSVEQKASWTKSHILRVPPHCDVDDMLYLLEYINAVGKAYDHRQAPVRFHGYDQFAQNVWLYLTALLVPMNETILKVLQYELQATFRSRELLLEELQAIDKVVVALGRYREPLTDRFFNFVASTYAYKLQHGLIKDRVGFEEACGGALKAVIEAAGRTQIRYALRSTVSLQGRIVGITRIRGPNRPKPELAYHLRHTDAPSHGHGEEAMGHSVSWHDVRGAEDVTLPTLLPEYAHHALPRPKTPVNDIIAMSNEEYDAWFADQLDYYHIPEHWTEGYAHPMTADYHSSPPHGLQFQDPDLQSAITTLGLNDSGLSHSQLRTACQTVAAFIESTHAPPPPPQESSFPNGFSFTYAADEIDIDYTNFSDICDPTGTPRDPAVLAAMEALGLGATELSIQQIYDACRTVVQRIGTVTNGGAS
ncbi:hypothetical protein BDV96DRAFT_337945 [Lophiotrema nucula]|uniref:Uncharacterized protein n=1 Tax=Lophiotrema nucula TaxID=690887 RepID=A0A6A5YH92_9PLEO|nr:hypothetical protein BDV96DRAFT_337945 [Lophiotrema nucula]